MDSENDSATLSLACSAAHGCTKKAQVRQKKKSAVKFFLCFRSGDVAFPRVVPVVSSSMTLDSDLDAVKCSNQQRKPGRHGFFHVLKAILFKTALVKKIQQRKSGKTVNIPTKESSGKTQEWSDHEDVPRRIIKTTCSGGNSVFTYVREKEEAVFPTMPSSLLDNEEKCQDQWINRGRRRLFCVLKAVLFETSLAKKIQARKLVKKYGSNGSLRPSTGESCEEFEDHHFPRKLTTSASSLTNSSVFTSSSLTSCSSSSTVSRSTSHSRSLSERIKSFRSISSSNLKANLRGLSEKIRSNSSGLKSNSRYLFERNKMSLESITSSGLREEQHAHFDDDMSTHIEKNNKKGGCYRSASGLCFLLMSLLGLIFYGRLCAILCTSMWLICVPLWSFGDHNWSTNNVVVEKKKVLMGGGMPARTARTRTFRSQ